MSFSLLTAGNVDPVLNLHLTVSENPGERYVNACLELNKLPSGGLECETAVYLEAQSVTASKFDASNCVNVMCIAGLSVILPSTVEYEDFKPFTIHISFDNSTDSGETNFVYE